MNVSTFVRSCVAMEAGREKDVCEEGRKVVGSLRSMIEMIVGMEVKNGLHNGIILLTLTYGSETWVWMKDPNNFFQKDLNHLKVFFFTHSTTPHFTLFA